MPRPERSLPETLGTFALHVAQVVASARSYEPYPAERESIDLSVGLQLVNHLNSQTSVPLFRTELPAAERARVRPARPDCEAGSFEERLNVSLHFP